MKFPNTVEVVAALTKNPHLHPHFHGCPFDGCEGCTSCFAGGLICKINIWKLSLLDVVSCGPIPSASILGVRPVLSLSESD